MVSGQTVKQVVQALEVCVVELITLEAQLREPYRSNVAAAAEQGKQALTNFKEALNG